ncbi:alpha/beta fold hydrolase [Reyranella sp. CPCC 100927]|uniref:alpha/beta fold hydrolase n=1 Tax=Reyranella sp. CPCC 100927 TaxID=2599616 RepID=UPI0015B73751|nr:alpha/beta fold hydrolase [Reyranella sp. CPCC 100927]
MGAATSGGTLHGAAGSDDGGTIVFVHGIGGAARVWAPQVMSLTAAGKHPVAIDLPGYGGRPLTGAMDFDGLASDLEATVAGLGLERPVLVGHSMGGMVVQAALRRRPAAYRAAVLCNTSPAFGSPDGDFQRKFVADRLAPLDAGAGMPQLAASMVDRLMGPTPDAAGRDLAVAVMSAVPEATYRAAVACLVHFDERANLPLIRVPVLCLAGAYDQAAPAAAMERMAARIPNARFCCLAGVGHLPNLEMPTAFDAAVIDFLSDLPMSTAA